MAADISAPASPEAILKRVSPRDTSAPAASGAWETTPWTWATNSCDLAEDILPETSMTSLRVSVTATAAVTGSGEGSRASVVPSSSAPHANRRRSIGNSRLIIASSPFAPCQLYQ